MNGTSLGSRLHLESFAPDRPAGDGDGQAVLLALTLTAREVAPLAAMVVGAGFGRMRTTVQALFPSPAGHRPPRPQRVP